MPGFVRYPHSALSRPAAQRPVDKAMRDVAERVLAAARSAEAYGLAAAHIGEVAPVVVISTASDAARRDYLVLFNPAVEAVAEETAPGPEGSVSLPGIEVTIDRPIWADITFEDGSGAIQRRRLEGFAGRCALHEIEQMNGVFFLARLSRLKRERALKRFAKLSAASG